MFPLFCDVVSGPGPGSVSGSSNKFFRVFFFILVIQESG